MNPIQLYYILKTIQKGYENNAFLYPENFLKNKEIELTEKQVRDYIINLDDESYIKGISQLQILGSGKHYKVMEPIQLTFMGQQYFNELVLEIKELDSASEILNFDPII